MLFWIYVVSTLVVGINSSVMLKEITRTIMVRSGVETENMRISVSVVIGVVFSALCPVLNTLQLVPIIIHYAKKPAAR